ncbi:MAG: hypothetical protein JWQ96_2321 [Segetibacter sp.]|nr:hypothetical protein [Segetibacter sp.]
MKKLLIVIVLLISIKSFSQDTTTAKKFLIGDSPIIISTACYLPCKAPIVFINVHDDENTSVEAAHEYLLENGGNLFQLQQEGARNIKFDLNNKQYIFDPNRIYTKSGRTASLKLLSTNNTAAAAGVELLASQILAEYIDNKILVIALHNNSDSNFSINSYKKGGSEAKNTGMLYINPLMDPDDFILTTEDTIYHYLKEKEISVVLQNNKTVADDGSMSVYAASKGIPYINVETQHGHKDEQLEMLRALKDIVKYYEERVEAEIKEFIEIQQEVRREAGQPKKEAAKQPKKKVVGNKKR